jgi:hypothetical protein
LNPSNDEDNSLIFTFIEKEAKAESFPARKVSLPPLNFSGEKP